jgi:hypothetical protein
MRGVLFFIELFTLRKFTIGLALAKSIFEWVNFG